MVRITVIYYCTDEWQHGIYLLNGVRSGFSLRIGGAGEYILQSNKIAMEGQSSLRKQAKFSRRILCSSRRILRSLMPN